MTATAAGAWPAGLVLAVATELVVATWAAIWCHRQGRRR